MGVIDWIKGRKGVTGFNASENNIKMSLMVLGPFLGLWLGIRILLPSEIYDIAVTISMFIWLAYVVMLWAWAKSDAAGYLPFPQSKWKFPDGTCKTFDLKVPPDSWEHIATLPDGREGYKVYFADNYFYQDPDLPYADIFDMAYWILPARWDDCFRRRTFGEFFHRGVYVTHPACEDISVYVVDWETKEGERFPICLINDCALTYKKVLEDYGTPLIDTETGLNVADGLTLLYRDGRKREDKLLTREAYLEDRLVIAEKESSEEWKKASDSRLTAVRSRHARIMSTKQPLSTRILNMKTLAFVLFVVLVTFGIGRVLFDWW